MAPCPPPHARLAGDIDRSIVKRHATPAKRTAAEHAKKECVSGMSQIVVGDNKHASQHKTSKAHGQTNHTNDKTGANKHNNSNNTTSRWPGVDAGSPLHRRQRHVSEHTN